MARSWRQFGERLAAAGFPTLRYDHPGQGDSLDPQPLTLEHWNTALIAAAHQLMRHSGAGRLVLIGHGIGATLALDNLPHLHGVAGLVAMAPVVQGRVWLRELAAWSAMIGGASEGELSVGGFTLPEDLAIGLRSLDIRDSRPLVPFNLMVAREARPDDAALAQAFAKTIPFEGYEGVTRDPTGNQAPFETYDAVIAELKAAFPQPEPAETGPRMLPPAVLSAAEFRETAVRFGANDQLYGILVEPLRPRSRLLTVFVPAGRDPHIGWSRIAVDHARRLAQAGYPSFRFDVSGNGESLLRAGQDGRELLYASDNSDDTATALGWLKRHGYDHTLLIGRCSGGYVALHTAAMRAEVKALIMVNVLRIIWDPTETVELALNADVRPLALQNRGFTDGNKLKKFLSGEIDRKAALCKAVRLIWRKMPAWPWSGAQRRLRQGRALFHALSERQANVTFVSAEEDGSLDRFAELFGPEGKQLSAYPGLSFERLIGSDHNLNQQAARDTLFAILMDRLVKTETAASSSA